MQLWLATLVALGLSISVLAMPEPQNRNKPVVPKCCRTYPVNPYGKEKECFTSVSANSRVLRNNCKSIMHSAKDKLSAVGWLSKVRGMPVGVQVPR